MEEKILIIDDDLETLRLVGLMLQRQGYQIISANNGALGIELAKKEKPDLIVLDVMMPDIDGFHVTKRLRADNEMNNTPILMFTAKSQVDDKVAGYEAGVDDYLIKPVHPVELVAHIKALLARRKRVTGPLPKARHGYVIGVISAKGGQGVSTVALNIGIALNEKSKNETVCVEISPNNGTWGLELGLADNQALNKLLQIQPEEINADLIKQSLVKSNFGVSLLLSSPSFSNLNVADHIEQVQTIIKYLVEMTQIVILDFGACNVEIMDKSIEFCDDIIIVSEAHPISIRRTKYLLEELNKKEFAKHKNIDILINNRTRADIQLSVGQIEDLLGTAPNVVIPPVPELSYQSVARFQPLIKIQPENLINQQYMRLADHILSRIRK